VAEVILLGGVLATKVADPGGEVGEEPGYPGGNVVREVSACEFGLAEEVADAVVVSGEGVTFKVGLVGGDNELTGVIGSGGGGELGNEEVLEGAGHIPAGGNVGGLVGEPAFGVTCKAASDKGMLAVDGEGVWVRCNLFEELVDGVNEPFQVIGAVTVAGVGGDVGEEGKGGGGDGGVTGREEEVSGGQGEGGGHGYCGRGGGGSAESIGFGLGIAGSLSGGCGAASEVSDDVGDGRDLVSRGEFSDDVVVEGAVGVQVELGVCEVRGGRGGGRGGHGVEGLGWLRAAGGVQGGAKTRARMWSGVETMLPCNKVQ
ncbi:hypothetical protein HK101_006559, partial [Irineochytrium annulatum]